MDINLTFHEALMGQLGQFVTCDSNRVWVTKTHHPMPTTANAFTAEKLIFVARNPIDVIPSFANLLNLNSHSLVPEQQYHIDFPE